MIAKAFTDTNVMLNEIKKKLLNQLYVSTSQNMKRVEEVVRLLSFAMLVCYF